MFILNFSHPLSQNQKREIENLLEEKVIEITFNVHFDLQKELAPQVLEVIEKAVQRIPQEEPVLVLPPSLASAASIAVMMLTKKLGYTPPIIRLKQAPDSLPPVWVLAEIIYLEKN